MANDFKFEDHSAEVKAELQRVTETALTKAAMLIESSAKSKAPVDTGHLRDNVDHKITGSGSKMTGQVGSPDKYAVYVEYGTGEFAENGAGRKGGWVYQDSAGKWHHTTGNKPQKFLRPAFRENKAKVKELLSGELGARFKGK